MPECGAEELLKEGQARDDSSGQIKHQTKGLDTKDDLEGIQAVQSGRSLQPKGTGMRVSYSFQVSIIRNL